VIPFFNGSAFIERAVDSVFAQSVRPLEVIVVDDGSTADEANTLQRVSRKHPIRLLKQPNDGQSSARNLGVREALGDLICFLDQDDYFLEWHIEHLMSLVPKRGDARFAFAYGDLWRGDEAGKVLHTSWLDKFSPHPKTDIEMQLREDCYIIPSASIISRKAFLEIGGFDERLIGYEDEDLFTRFFAAGYTSVFSPRPVTFWTINESSASFSIHLARSRWIYFEKILGTYPDRPGANESILRDCLVPRFTYPFIDDYLKSCFIDDGYLTENRQRLEGFLAILNSHSSCAGFTRHKKAVGLLIRLHPRTVVLLGAFVGSRWGGLILGPIGKRTMRPRLRELVLMREMRKRRDAEGTS
jgi:glycosyltransferase involved in cell wall biosynthesis